MDLHSTVVLLKAINSKKVVIGIIHLHSTVVLLKLKSANLIAFGGKFTFYCSSIKVKTRKKICSFKIIYILL